MALTSGEIPNRIKKKVIRSFQSIFFRLKASATWYIKNNALHKYLKILTVDQLTKQYYIKFHKKL
jgi:hypothetical protein